MANTVYPHRILVYGIELQRHDILVPDSQYGGKQQKMIVAYFASIRDGQTPSPDHWDCRLGGDWLDRFPESWVPA